MKASTISLLTAAAISLPSSSIASNALRPPGPQIGAKAYYLSDFHSGAVLAEYNRDARIEPASLTKLMTAYLTFKALKEQRLTLQQELTVSKKGWKTGGSRMFLDPKVPATVNDLIKGMIVQSGNDACVTLAEAIAGSEENFAKMMTKQAHALGMKHTHFRNATGLPHPDHYTTVHDLNTLANVLTRDFPVFHPTYSLKSFTYNNIKQPNRNQLLYRDPNINGMKTGYTRSAGYNMITTNNHDGRRLISVVVGTDSPEARAVASSKLLHYGLQFYDTPKLYSAGKSAAVLSIYKGALKTVALGFTSDVYTTVKKGYPSLIKPKISIMQPLVAPVKAGEVVGKLLVSLNGKQLLARPVVALHTVKQGGWFSRVCDSIRLILDEENNSTLDPGAEHRAESD